MGSKFKLKREWFGPYTVIKRTNEVDYEIIHNGHVYIVHANLLKPYYE